MEAERRRKLATAVESSFPPRTHCTKSLRDPRDARGGSAGVAPTLQAEAVPAEAAL